MKIKEMHVENFRSINKITVRCSDFNILIGKNSVGKSNTLLALDLFFNTSDRILTEDMFCSFTDTKGNIIIELTFNNLTEAEKTGRLKKYVCSSLEQGIKVRKTIERVENKLKSRYQGWVEEPMVEWLKSDFKGYRRQAYWKEENIDFFAYTEVEGGQISKELYEEFRKKYIEKHCKELKFELVLSETEFEGLKTVGVDMLPQFKLVPAIGDVSEVVAGTSKSLLARIVRDIIRTATQNAEVLMEAEKRLEEAATLINRGEGKKRLKQVEAVENWFREEFREWGKIDFEIRTSFPEVDTLLTQNLQLLVDDGARGDIATKGHGLQRQLIFKMIQLSAALVEGKVDWMGVEGALPESAPIILAFEEPELYLHPQAQLSFYEDIQKLSLRDQLFLCTHSPYLVDLENSEGIKILKRETLTSPTTIYECTHDIWEDMDLKKRLSLAKLFDANVNKIFFADKIIIVEGDTDLIGITRTAREHAKCFSHRVTIVNAGGKERIPCLQRVLNAFKIPYTVVYDIDPGNKKSKETTELIESLVGLDSPFGLAASMPMDPNLAAVIGYEEPKDDKAAACVGFLDENKPVNEFIEKVKTLYKLPAAGIITPE
jgi:predicted ATP-dependent endonuclease of OLD family